VVTDNLDNFSNRDDRHRLSTPSTPQDEATLTLSLAPTLPCSKVIAVTEVIGYRRSPPYKWRRLDNLARSPLTPRFLLPVKLAISLDPLRVLYSLTPLVLMAIPVPYGGLEDVEAVEQSLKSFEILVPHQVAL